LELLVHVIRHDLVLELLRQQELQQRAQREIQLPHPYKSKP
jgi:hypothetical protein